MILAIFIAALVQLTGAYEHYRRDGGLDMRYSDNRNPGYNMNGDRDARYNGY